MSRNDEQKNIEIDIDNDRVSNASDKFYLAFAALGVGFAYGMFNPIVVPILIIVSAVTVMVWAVVS